MIPENDLDRAFCKIAAELLHDTSEVWNNRICDEIEIPNTETNREILKVGELEEAENGDYTISDNGETICLRASVLMELCADKLEEIEKIKYTSVGFETNI